MKGETEEGFIHTIVNSTGDQALLVDKFVGDALCGKLCQALKAKATHSKKLLNLRGNCIGYLGSVAIGELIEASTTIETLVLEWNNLGHNTAAVGVIASALEKNNRLLHLDLRNNHVDDDDATALARAIAVNERLQKLDLRWNSITDAGAVALLSAAQQRSAHIEIQLTGNRVTESLEKTITTTCGPARPSRSKQAVEELPTLHHQQQQREQRQQQEDVRQTTPDRHHHRHGNDGIMHRYAPQHLVPQSPNLTHDAPVSTEALQSYAAAWVDERRQMERAAAVDRQTLEAQLREAAANTVALESELLSTHTRLTQTEDTLAIEKERLDELRKELASLRMSHDREKNELVKQVRHFEREASDLRLDAEAKADQVAELEHGFQRKVKGLQQQIQETQELNGRLETDNIRMKAQVSELEDHLAKLTNEAERLRLSQNAQERSSAESRQALLQRMQEAQQQFDTKLLVAEQRAGQLTKENVELSEQLRRLESQVVTWEAQKVRDIAAAIHQAREEEQIRRADEVTELKMQVEGLITAHRDSETRADELHNELKRLNHDSASQIQALDNRVSTQLSDLQATRRELDAERVRCKTAVGELRNAQSELDTSKDLVGRLRSERTVLERDIENLRTKLSIAHREEAQHWEATVNDLRHQLLQAEAKFNAASAQLAEHRRNEQEYLHNIQSALLGSVQQQIVDVLATHPKR